MDKSEIRAAMRARRKAVATAARAAAGKELSRRLLAGCRELGRSGGEQALDPGI